MKHKVFLQYFSLMKPKIVLGNLLAVLGGFCLASKRNINFPLLFWALFSTFLLISASCLLNNYFDFDIDQNMKRTRKRISIHKNIFLKKKIIFFSIFLGISGLFFSYFKINALVSYLGFTGLFLYVFVYTYIKRKSAYSTLLGGIPGSIPVLMGYCSVKKIDACFIILFFMYFLWQIPHFYSISIMHYRDYKKINIPVFPIKFGLLSTKYHIAFYIFSFILSSSMLTFFRFVGYSYLIITNVFNIFWLFISIQGILKKNIIDFFWAKKMFLCSIIVLIVTNIMMIMDVID